MLTKQALYARHVEGAGKEREIEVLLTPPPLPLIYIANEILFKISIWIN